MEIEQICAHFGVPAEMLTGQVYVVKTIKCDESNFTIPSHEFNISPLFPNAANTISIVKGRRIEILAIADDGEVSVNIDDTDNLLIDGIGV